MICLHIIDNNLYFQFYKTCTVFYKNTKQLMLMKTVNANEIFLLYKTICIIFKDF